MCGSYNTWSLSLASSSECVRWFRQIAACISPSLFFLVEYSSIIWIYHDMGSVTDTHFKFSFFFSVMNNAAVTINVST